EDGVETIREAFPRQLPLLACVPADGRDDVLRQVAGTQLDPERDAAGLPFVVLLPRPEVAIVQPHPHPLPELEEQALGLQEHLFLTAFLEDRDDDGLNRRGRGREDEPLLVAVDRDQRAEEPLAHPVGRLVDEPVLAFLRLIGDVVDLREIVAVVVERRELGGPPGRQQGVCPQAVVGPWELVPVRPPRDQVRKGRSRMIRSFIWRSSRICCSASSKLAWAVCASKKWISRTRMKLRVIFVSYRKTGTIWYTLSGR